MSIYTQWQTNPTAVNDYIQNPIRNPNIQIMSNDEKAPWPSTKGKNSITQLSPQQKKDNERWPLSKYLDTGKSLLPVYSRTSRSANDFSGLSFGRFQQDGGFFNPDGIPQVWAPTDVQQVRHIIQAESQRGGLHSRQMVKESWNTP